MATVVFEAQVLVAENLIKKTRNKSVSLAVVLCTVHCASVHCRARFLFLGGRGGGQTFRPQGG